MSVLRVVYVAARGSYGLSTETDTLLRVKDGSLPDERLDTTGSSVDLVKGDLSDDLGSVLPEIWLESPTITAGSIILTCGAS